MTLHTIQGTPLRTDEILNTFFEDVAKAHGWRLLGQAMDWVQTMENGKSRYYLIGSRAMGLHRPSSDLDILTGPDQPWIDFEQAGIDLKEFLWVPKPKKVEGQDAYGYLVKTEVHYDELEWGLARLDPVLEIQLRQHDWLRRYVWETVLGYYMGEMTQFSKLPKNERRLEQNRLFTQIEKEIKTEGSIV